MKTKQLTLIGTILALSALSLPFIISETSPKPELPKTPNLELIDNLVDLGCTEPAINHLLRSSNLLDDSFDGTYFIDAIGYPDGLSQVEFDKCIKIILEKRTSAGLENNTALNKIEILQISNKIMLSKGIGFDLPEDTFTQEDLKQLQQKETDLRKIADSPETLDEQRRQIHLEINDMQDRLQYPFQNGMPYLLVKAIKEKFVILENNFDDIRKDVHFSRLSSNQISSEHHALRIGIHPDSFTLSEIEYQDEKIREYLGSEMNILYESVLIMPN